MLPGLNPMMRRISFAAAVARAGSLEAVLARLRAGDVMACHGGLYNKDRRPIRRKDDHIPVEWWKTARDIDPAAGRVWFRRYIIDDRPARHRNRARGRRGGCSMAARARAIAVGVRGNVSWDDSTGREEVGSRGEAFKETQVRSAASGLGEDCQTVGSHDRISRPVAQRQRRRYRRY